MAVKQKEIRVDVLELLWVDQAEVHEFQGAFKGMDDQAEAGLKAALGKFGLSACLSAWKDKGKLKLLDGHQRIRTIRKFWPGEQKIPVLVVEADGEKQARQKVLALASTYGRLDVEALKVMLRRAGIRAIDAPGLLSFPEVDLRLALEVEGDKGKDAQENEDGKIECPRCKARFKD